MQCCCNKLQHTHLIYKLPGQLNAEASKTALDWPEVVAFVHQRKQQANHHQL
jgi:hypothetical protein